ncbi:MAG: YggS family pyridoxal phosphate-dependent enzyme [Treponema sp.]|jgi:pyridoxal phosphate enzyme (YggS family)|nr:YggS family pyridoxal phosphate-dependent enzyme [Treponema sp.]
MTIAEALGRINERIHEACLRSGRDPAAVRLMGVSKFHESPALEEAWNGGIRLFGESRVQEAVRKFTGFKPGHPGTELHMIGSLQRNKARTAAALFDAIQSVDRDELITGLGALTGEREGPLMILLEMHTGEASKAGYPDTDSLCRAAEKVLAFPNLEIRGLMTMAPYTEDEKTIRASFRSLAAARDKLEARFPDCDWTCLSMGMSNDFEIAIEEGSSLVRIGTALFGERKT